jgi:hypothetical protein
MTRILSVLLVVLTSTFFAGVSRGAEPPVFVAHEVTGQHKRAKEISIDYLLHVVNAGEKPLSDLTLSVVPSPLFPRGKVVLKVGALAPHQRADLTFQLKATTARNSETLSREPLFIGGRYLDTDRKVIEFPAKSYPGGVR